jgi:hypothetical protein
MVKVVVERSKWHRGKGAIGSKLVLPNGTSCCLGFVGREIGFDDAEMRDYTSPMRMRGDLSRWPKGLLNQDMNSEVCSALMRSNDDPELFDSVRENLLIGLGREAGIEFEFVD